jgi:hypothetical protein
VGLCAGFNQTAGGSHRRPQPRLLPR